MIRVPISYIERLAFMTYCSKDFPTVEYRMPNNSYDIDCILIFPDEETLMLWKMSYNINDLRNKWLTAMGL